MTDRTFPFPWNHRPLDRAWCWCCYHAVLLLPLPWVGWRATVATWLLPRAGSWAYYWTDPMAHEDDDGAPSHD